MFEPNDMNEHYAEMDLDHEQGWVLYLEFCVQMVSDHKALAFGTAEGNEGTLLLVANADVDRYLDTERAINRSVHLPLDLLKRELERSRREYAEKLGRELDPAWFDEDEKV